MMDTKAVSPVIAVILLILITVGVVVSFYSWYESMEDTQQKKGIEKSADVIKQIKSSIKILDLRNESGSYIVTVWNDGDIRLTNITLYVDDRLDAGNLSALDANQLGSITSSLITTNGTYKLKVTTAQGAGYTWSKEV